MPLSWVSQTRPRILKASPPARARRRISRRCSSSLGGMGPRIGWCTPDCGRAEPKSEGRGRTVPSRTSDAPANARTFQRCVIMPSWRTRRAAAPPVVRALRLLSRPYRAALLQRVLQRHLHLAAAAEVGGLAVGGLLLAPAARRAPRWPGCRRRAAPAGAACGPAPRSM